MQELNERQRQFVNEYVVDYNATQAAKRAGYSTKTAYSQGQRLLKHVEVSKAIAQNIANKQEKHEIHKNIPPTEVALPQSIGVKQKLHEGQGHWPQKDRAGFFKKGWKPTGQTGITFAF